MAPRPVSRLGSAFHSFGGLVRAVKSPLASSRQLQCSAPRQPGHFPSVWLRREDSPVLHPHHQQAPAHTIAFLLWLDRRLVIHTCNAARSRLRFASAGLQRRLLPSDSAKSARWPLTRPYSVGVVGCTTP